MAADLTVVVIAVFVLLSVTILATRVRQDHWIVFGLLKATTVAGVFWHLALSVCKLAVRTGPVVKSQKAFLSRFNLRLFFTFIADVVNNASLSLFIFVLSDVLLQTLVQLLDPSLDATQVEWLTASFAIPESTALVNWIVTDHAFFSPLSQRLD